jgi:tetratricopeptide (TPR) repeat protein
MSLSRGPWLAAIAGIAALALLVWFLAGARTLGRAAILTAIAAVIAVASLQLPVMPPREGELLQNGSEASDPEGLIGRASGIGDELSRGGVSGRLSIWSRTATLIVQRPWFDPEQKGNIALRHLFGYGPEMFLYAFPTIENLDSEKQVNASPHNYLLLITAELGIAGLLAFAAMMGAATLGAGKLIAKGRRHVDTPLLIVVAGLGCVLIVRAVEQMTGVARVSDTALFWASLGLLVAAARMAQTKPLDAIEQHAVDWPSPITARVLRWGIASLVVAIAVVLLVPKNVSYVRAASLAASAYATLRTGDGLSAIETMARASAAAPDTDYYYLAQSDILGLFEAPNDEIALEIAKERHRLSAAALAANPLSHQALSYLATATGRLFDLGQRERGPEAIALFEEINRRIFTNQIFYQGLAIAHVKMGQPERAVEALDEVERLLDGHVLILPDLYYIRGVAYQDMGRTEDAIRELDRYVSDHEQITYRLYALDRLLALVDADEHPGEIERYEELRGKTLVLLEQQ